MTDISKLEPNDTTKVAMLECEIERLIADVESRGRSITTLEAENERLRAALDEILSWGDNGDAMANIARKALMSS